MVISYVLRVRPELAHDGNISGEVEAVGTGKRTGFASMAQLADILTKSLPDEVAKAEMTDHRRSPMTPSTTPNWSPNEEPTVSGTTVGVQPSLRIR